MKAFVMTALVAVTMAVVSAVPASAQDWWQDVIRQSQGQSAETGGRASRKATRTARAESKAQRRAASSFDDDGSRPQRRAAVQPRSTGGSLSGGQMGVASYYWQPQRVASGGWFNPNAMTAAHKTLPFGTRVRVTRTDTGRSVVVTINDRGPYIRGRIIDLSRAAAQSIGMTGQGLARVQVAVLGR